MPQISPECDELRVSLERLRALLENLVVRGLRACGPDELAQLRSYTQHLEQSGAGHVAGVLGELHSRIEKDDRGSARALLEAQTSVRLLERLLTLRVVREQYRAAIAALDAEAAGGAGLEEVEAEDGDEDDQEE
jgi:hypothetical protein